MEDIYNIFISFSNLGQFIRSIEEIGREDAVNALFCGCSLYRIITLEESMGSDLCNNSHPTNAEETEELKPDNLEEEKSKTGDISNDMFIQGVAQTPSSSENSNITEKTFYQPTQNINPAVKSNSQLGSSNADTDVSTHISMSVSGQARVNSNVSR